MSSLDMMIIQLYLQGERIFWYEEAESLAKTLLKIGGFYLLISILGAALSSRIGCFVFSKFPLLMKIITIGSIVLSAVIIIYSFHVLQVYNKGMIVGAVVVGISVGLCIGFQCSSSHLDTVSNR